MNVDPRPGPALRSDQNPYAPPRVNVADADAATARRVKPDRWAMVALWVSYGLSLAQTLVVIEYDRPSAITQVLATYLLPDLRRVDRPKLGRGVLCHTALFENEVCDSGS
jgi:hypothetical protein